MNEKIIIKIFPIHCRRRREYTRRIWKKELMKLRTSAKKKKKLLTEIQYKRNCSDIAQFYIDVIVKYFDNITLLCYVALYWRIIIYSYKILSVFTFINCHHYNNNII